MKSTVISSILGLLLFLCNHLVAQNTKISSDPYSKIFVDGTQVSTAAYEAKLKKNACLHVRVERPGYISSEQTICNNGNLKKTYYIPLEKDEAYESSVSTDIANRDFMLDSKRTPEETWLIISQILQEHFDVLEVMDENTGYARTAWVAHNYNGSTVRTRLIVKLGSAQPLSFKIKVQSEIAPAGTSVKEDELFKPWDRILRIYEPIVSEMQNRIKGSVLSKNKNG